MKTAVLAAAVIAFSVLPVSGDFGGSQAQAANYASESTRNYCAKKAKRYADKRAGQRTARNMAGGAVGGALLGGIFQAEAVAFGAEMIALSVCEIGWLEERRVGMLVDPALSGIPALLTPKPWLYSGLMFTLVSAAALVW